MKKIIKLTIRNIENSIHDKAHHQNHTIEYQGTEDLMITYIENQYKLINDNQLTPLYDNDYILTHSYCIKVHILEPDDIPPSAQYKENDTNVNPVEYELETYEDSLDFLKNSNNIFSQNIC